MRDVPVSPIHHVQCTVECTVHCTVQGNTSWPTSRDLPLPSPAPTQCPAETSCGSLEAFKKKMCLFKFTVMSRCLIQLNFNYPNLCPTMPLSLNCIAASHVARQWPGVTSRRHDSCLLRLICGEESLPSRDSNQVWQRFVVPNIFSRRELKIFLWCLVMYLTSICEYINLLLLTWWMTPLKSSGSGN